MKLERERERERAGEGEREGEREGGRQGGREGGRKGGVRFGEPLASECQPKQKSLNDHFSTPSHPLPLPPPSSEESSDKSH